MMSRRDALRSYRRQFKRAYATSWRETGTAGHLRYRHPAMVELGKRGDRLKAAYTRLDRGDWPLEVEEAMTSADITYCADPKNDEELPW